jgi:hypothetical protein
MLQDAWMRHSAQESLMSITSLGGAASQRWQILKESRANPSAGSSVTSVADHPRPPRGPPSAASGLAGSVNAGGASTGVGDISSASAKVITDLKALFISMQSSASDAVGLSGANAGAAPPADASGTDAPNSATASTTTHATATAASAPRHSEGLLDEILGALKAYATSSSGNSAKAATTLSA